MLAQNEADEVFYSCSFYDVSDETKSWKHFDIVHRMPIYDVSDETKS